MADIAGIVFSGDSFRSVDGRPDQIENVTWLKDKLGHMLSVLTQKPHSISVPLVGNNTSAFFYMQDETLRPSLNSWAALFWDHASPRIIESVAEQHADKLVITIEMPPIIQDALDKAHVPWIDVSISPLRFMPDWAFHVKASSHFDLSVVSEMLLSQPQINGYAQHVKAWYGAADISEPTLVFFAQTSSDRTLISGKRFAGRTDVLEALDRIRANKPVLIKAHPWQPSSDVVDALVDAGGKVTDLNTYALLASRPIEVATLSSSAGREAKHFGRSVTTISPSVQDWAFSGVDVLHHALSPRFWGALLASAGIAVRTAPEPIWVPNALRGSIPPQGLDPAVWSRDASILRA